jgi:hypothetical protein
VRERERGSRRDREASREREETAVAHRVPVRTSSKTIESLLQLQICYHSSTYKQETRYK